MAEKQSPYGAEKEPEDLNVIMDKYVKLKFSAFILACCVFYKHFKN